MLVFFRKTIIDMNMTKLQRAYVIEFRLIPIGDSPRNSPDIPAMLKLNATERTDCSTMSSFPFWKIKLTRQYPGTKATKVNPKNALK